MKPGNKHREAYTGKYAGRSEASPLQRSISPVRSLDVDGDVVTCAEASITNIVRGEMCVGLPGFEGRGMYTKKRTQTREILVDPVYIAGSATQLTEERARLTGKSDPFIVVGDGKAAHKANGWARLHLGNANTTRREGSRQMCQESYSKYQNQTVCFWAGNREEPYAGKPHVGICEGAAR